MYRYDGGGGQFELGVDGFFGEGGGGDGGGSERGFGVHGVLQDGQPLLHLIALLGSTGTELSWSFLGISDPLIGTATKKIRTNIARSDDILYYFAITEI